MHPLDAASAMSPTLKSQDRPAWSRRDDVTHPLPTMATPPWA